MVFEGHVNSYLGHLVSLIEVVYIDLELILCLQGIAIDPDQDFLFAAGQDSRLRGWSLRTGLPLCSESLPDNHATPFNSLFPSPISALQVTRDLGSNSLSLWAAYEHDLCRFHLGQRAHPLRLDTAR